MKHLTLRKIEKITKNSGKPIMFTKNGLPKLAQTTGRDVVVGNGGKEVSFNK